MKQNLKTHEELNANVLLTPQHSLQFNKLNRRNNNVVVIGGSDTGKTFSYVKPNVTKANSSFVIIDEAGEIYDSTKESLIERGYSVKVLNLMDYKNGNKYNPFDYIRRKEDGSYDASSVVSMIACFTDCKGSNFYSDVMEAFLCSAVFYLIESCPREEWNLCSFAKLIRKTVDNDIFYDELMSEVKKKNPNSTAYSFYETYKLAGGNTAKGIRIEADIKISKIYIEDMIKSTTADTDEMNNIDLNTIGDEKTAIFIITPTDNSQANFLCSMLCNQLFDILYNKAPSKIPISCFFDENIELNELLDFSTIIATCSRYNISISILLQAYNVAKKDRFILSNCDHLLFFGSIELAACKDVANVIKSMSPIKTKSAKNMITPEQLNKKDNDKCIYVARGEEPVEVSKINPLVR